MCSSEHILLGDKAATTENSIVCNNETMIRELAYFRRRATYYLWCLDLWCSLWNSNEATGITFPNHKIFDMPTYKILHNSQKAWDNHKRLQRLSWNPYWIKREQVSHPEFWCWLHFWFRLRGSASKVDDVTALPSRHKMADMCYYGNVMTITRWWLCVTMFYIFNSTVIDWTVFCHW